MEINYSQIAERIHNTLMGANFEVEAYDNTGSLEVDPRNASRFVSTDPDIVVNLDRDQQIIKADIDSALVNDPIIESLRAVAVDYGLDFDYEVIGKSIKPKTEAVLGGKKPYFKVSPNVPWTPHTNRSSGKKPRLRRPRQEGVRVALSIIDKQPIYHVILIKNPEQGDRDFKIVSTHDYKEDADRKARLYAMSHDVPVLEGVADMANIREEMEVDEKINIKGLKRFVQGSDLDSREQQELDAADKEFRMGDVQKGQKHYKNYSRLNRLRDKPETVSTEGVMEGFGHMLGSTKTSYQPLDSVKIIVRHKAPVSEEVRGSRSRNIKEIFIQRGDERFRMKENNLQAARAMARHVYNGGEVYDDVGKAINEMATEHKALRSFVQFVSRSGLVNETNQEYVDLAQKRVSSIREAFRKLTGVKTYANAVEGLNTDIGVELNETDLDLESKFSSISCDSRVVNAVASMRATIARQNAFESTIKEAIARETFTGVKNRLQEQDAIQFENPQARLAYQVSQFSGVAENAKLGNYLSNISKKIAEGMSLESFEKETVKLCLERARCQGGRKKRSMESRTSIKESRSYAEFLNKFDIF